MNIATAIVQDACILTPVPFLAAAFQTFKATLDLVEELQTLREQASALVELTATILIRIDRKFRSSNLTHSNDEHLEGGTRESIESLEDTLNNIHVDLSKIAHMPFLKRLIKRDEITSIISRHTESLPIVLQLFSVESAIDAAAQNQRDREARVKDSEKLDALLQEAATRDAKLTELLKMESQGQVNMREIKDLLALCTRQIRHYGIGRPERAFFMATQRKMQSLSRGAIVPAPGWSVSPYEVELEEEIGRGAFSKVYRGTLDGKVVGIKMLEEGADESILTKEANIWRTLDHPRVHRFIRACPTGNPPFIVSEFHENGDAVSYLERNPDADRLNLIRDIASGMEYLHSQRCLHGDLKASNILVDSNGRACVSDFGLSLVKMKSSMVAPRLQSGPRYITGTTAWMSPERLRGGPLNTAVDVYAFAMTAYELLTGELPFSQQFHDELVTLVGERGMRPPRPEFLPLPMGTNPDDVWALIEECWNQNPKLRPSFDSILSRLNGLIRFESSSRPSSGIEVQKPLYGVGSRAWGRTNRGSMPPVSEDETPAATSSVATSSVSNTWSPAHSHPSEITEEIESVPSVTKSEYSSHRQRYSYYTQDEGTEPSEQVEPHAWNEVPRPSPLGGSLPSFLTQETYAVKDFSRLIDHVRDTPARTHIAALEALLRILGRANKAERSALVANELFPALLKIFGREQPQAPKRSLSLFGKKKPQRKVPRTLNSDEVKARSLACMVIEKVVDGDTTLSAQAVAANLCPALAEVLGVPVPRLRAQACQTLFKFDHGNPQVAKRFVDEGIAAALANFLKSKETESDIVEYSLVILKQLVPAVASNHKLIPLLVSSLSGVLRMLHSENINICVCQTFEALARSNPDTLISNDSEVLISLVPPLRSSDHTLIKAVCAVIAAICGGTLFPLEPIKPFKSSGPMVLTARDVARRRVCHSPILTALIDLFNENSEEVKKAAVRTYIFLATFCETKVADTDLIVERQVAVPLLNLLPTTSQPVQILICEALINFSQVERVRKAITDAGCLKVVSTILQNVERPSRLTGVAQRLSSTLEGRATPGVTTVTPLTSSSTRVY